MNNDSEDESENEMNHTKNVIPVYAKNFFTKIENYLNTKIYYFGSVQRNDYFFGDSDIDVCIFTSNESNTILKLQNLLKKPKRVFRKIVNYLPTCKQIVYGYVVTYKNLKHNFSTDICIYDNKYKENVLKDNKFKIYLPFYISFLLLIVKTLYYRLHLLSKPIYTYFKKLIMDILDDGDQFMNTRTNTWKFLVFEIPNVKMNK